LPSRNALVLTVDRLGTFCLGPYGNTWVETPGWNRLASQSLLCEQMLVDTPNLADGLRSYWCGQHAFCTGPAVPSLARQLQGQGVHPVLLTDDPQVAGLPLAEDFEQVRILPPPKARRAAASLERTHLARVLADVLGMLEELPVPWLAWVHLQGLGAAWDAPTELRNQFADEDDPLPGDFVEPPNYPLGEDPDPDLQLMLSHAYAGQNVVLDACLEILLEAIDAASWSPKTLLTLASNRGYPLGEHGRVGPCDEALYGELLHVPCLFRYPDRRRAAWRLADPVQPADVYATLASWFGLPPQESQNAWGRDLALLRDARLDHAARPACCRGPGQRAIRTADWFLRAPDQGPAELFGKPDDLWEVNEVARRCPEVVGQLLEQLDAFEQAAIAGRPDLIREFRTQEAGEEAFFSKKWKKN
jgi:arylsulfatase A-like enzyme